MRWYQKTHSERCRLICVIVAVYQRNIQLDTLSADGSSQLRALRWPLTAAGVMKTDLWCVLRPSWDRYCKCWSESHVHHTLLYFGRKACTSWILSPGNSSQVGLIKSEAALSVAGHHQQDAVDALFIKIIFTVSDIIKQNLIKSFQSVRTCGSSG